MRKLILTSIGNPWDYLNGTNYAFGIDAGEGNSLLTAGYLLVRNVVLVIACLLVLSSIAGMIWAKNSQDRAQGKSGLMQRLGVVLIVGASAGVMTFLMTLCNLFFGVA